MIKKSSLPKMQTELTNQKATRTVITCQGTRKAPIGYWLIMSDSKWSWKRGGRSGEKQPWCWTISVFGCFSLLLSYRSWPYFFRLHYRRKINPFTNKLRPNFLHFLNCFVDSGKENSLRRANLGLFQKVTHVLFMCSRSPDMYVQRPKISGIWSFSRQLASNNTVRLT